MPSSLQISTHHHNNMAGYFVVRTFRTSFILLILASTFQSLSAFHSNHVVPFAADKNTQNTNNAQLNHLLDRRRRDALPQQEVSVEENKEIGSVVFVVTGSDTGDRFAQSEPENPRFTVDERTGNIILMESLDYESLSQEIIDIEITNVNNQGKMLFVFYCF